MQPEHAKPGEYQRDAAGKTGKELAGNGVVGYEADPSDEAGTHCPESEHGKQMIGLPIELGCQPGQHSHRHHQHRADGQRQQGDAGVASYAVVNGIVGSFRGHG